MQWLYYQLLQEGELESYSWLLVVWSLLVPSCVVYPVSLIIFIVLEDRRMFISAGWKGSWYHHH